MKKLFVILLASMWIISQSICSAFADSAYSGASDWAKAELDNAQAAGFISGSISENMSDKISREEFAEIAVLLG